ncbi:MAG: extracellular solute-binding protein [Bacteroidetes bacterium]|nr:extracellular solute-binding protein [Bacteroidota bacterium]
MKECLRKVLIILMVMLVVGLPLYSRAQNDAVEETKDDTIILKWYGSGFLQSNKDQILIDRYTEIEPNIQIEYVDLGGTLNEEFFSKYDVLVASGEQADIAYMGVLDILKRALNGAMLSINEYIEMNGDDFSADYGEDYKMLDIEGNIYGVPHALNAFRVFYNIDWLESIGISIPDNWNFDQFLDIARQITDPENGIYGAFFPLTWFDMTYAPAQVAGWNMVKEVNGKVVPNFDDPLFRKNMEYLYQMTVTEQLNPDLPTSKAERLNRRIFLAEKQAPIIMDSWYSLAWINGYRYDSETKRELDFNIGVTDFPRLNENVPEDVNFSSLVGAWAIPKTSKYPEEAYKFARFIANDNPDQLMGIPAYKKINIEETTKSFTNYLAKDGTQYNQVYPTQLVIDTLTIKDKSHFGYYNFDPLLFAKYSALLDQLYQQEVELYLIGENTLDEFVATMQMRGAEEMNRLD